MSEPEKISDTDQHQLWQWIMEARRDQKAAVAKWLRLLELRTSGGRIRTCDLRVMSSSIAFVSN